MPIHDQFLELCALAAIGELSPEEWQRLEEHARECGECQKELREYRQLATNWLPLADRPGIHAWLPTDASRQCREGFLQRARAAGLRISTESRRPPLPWTIGPKLRSLARYGATAAVAAAFTFGMVWLRTKPVAPIVVTIRPVPQRDGMEALARENAALHAALDAARRSLDEEPVSPVAGAAREQTAAAEEAARAHQIQQLLDASRRELDDVRQQLSHTRSEAGDAAARLAAGMHNLESMGRELEAAREAHVRDQAAASAQQIRLDELSQQLRLQTASVDRSRDLLSADRDIRDIMGARNLHIIDVHDTDGKGKPRAAFGRIFYTEGKSLLFYAFDLDRGGVKDVSFQAWGQRDGEHARPAVSLGVLYLDDKNQSRWVLKFNDEAVLRQIDSVFVTAASPAQHNSTGRKLLYAYFGNLINHP